MQHRYTGDIGDFFKLAILRIASRSGRLGVFWWLHPDELHNGDGRHIQYLEQPDRWRELDPVLFDQLGAIVHAQTRHVSALENDGLVPNSKYFADPIPVGPGRRDARLHWFAGQLRHASECDVVFVDPDNGIDLREDADQRASAKHVTVRELSLLAAGGASVIAYHHQTRRAGGHLEEIRWIMTELRKSGFRSVSALRAGRVSPRAFFILNASPQLSECLSDLADRHPRLFDWFSEDEQSASAHSSWRASILTLYPEVFPGPLGASLAGKALEKGTWSLEAKNIRDFATDKHRSVDDTPAGGGAGMVLRPDVLVAALDSVADGRPMLAMTPRGAPLTQARVRELATGAGAIILCGRFEGFDERIFEARPIEPVSIGDYVLSGGELGAMVLLDACVRLLPGVMGATSSGEEESFEAGLLEYPHYTRPVTWEGRTIPEVLRSGDHARIASWRHERALEDTRLRRPDLIERQGGASQAPPSGARHENEG
jgi:tRNA (guanine37-N1)-methyltransferase